MSPHEESINNLEKNDNSNLDYNITNPINNNNSFINKNIISKMRFKKLIVEGRPNAPKEIVLRAILGGLRSCVMAYGIRGGVNFLLNLLTVFRKRKGTIYRAFIHGFFGKDAIRFAVGFGGFSFLWKFINNGLRYMRNKDDKWNSFIAGSIAGISLLAEKRERRVAISQQLFVRALQALFNAGHARKYFRFPHGVSLLFIITTGQVLYAYTMQPNTIPSDFFQWMVKMARVPKETLDLNLKLTRGNSSLELSNMTKILNKYKGTRHAYKVVSNLPPNPVTFNSCTYTTTERFYQVFKTIVPVYATLNFVPMIALKFAQFMKDPKSLIKKGTANTVRSSVFLATFIASYQSQMCLHRNLVKSFGLNWNSKYLYWLAGIFSSAAIFIEHKSRRTDLALYVLPKAAESWYKIMYQKNWIFELNRTADIWFFSTAMGVIMTFYQHEPEVLSPMLKKILFHFFGEN
nr:8354_t:CDS:2 [Entrophospora candida]CAG8592414.1 599_t:CDS:2 [Entrophospora candida]